MKVSRKVAKAIGIGIAAVCLWGVGHDAGVSETVDHTQHVQPLPFPTTSQPDTDATGTTDAKQFKACMDYYQDAKHCYDDVYGYLTPSPTPSTPASPTTVPTTLQSI